MFRNMLFAGLNMEAIQSKNKTDSVANEFRKKKLREIEKGIQFKTTGITKTTLLTFFV